MTKIPETEHGGIDWAEMERRGKRGDVIEGVETPQAGLKAARVAQSPLDRYRARKSITARQWAAGDELRTDYLAATHNPSQGFDGMPRAGAPGSASVTDAQLDASKRVNAALAAVRSDAARVLTGVVRDELTMPSVAIHCGYANADQAMGALKLALNQLADYYRMPE